MVRRGPKRKGSQKKGSSSQQKSRKVSHVPNAWAWMDASTVAKQRTYNASRSRGSGPKRRGTHRRS